MRKLHNIERSAFRREYVGYSNGLVWRIGKSNSSFGRWQAWNDSTDMRLRSTYLYAWSLEEMSAKLEAVKVTA